MRPSGRETQTNGNIARYRRRRCGFSGKRGEPMVMTSTAPDQQCSTRKEYCTMAKSKSKSAAASRKTANLEEGFDPMVRAACDMIEALEIINYMRHDRLTHLQHFVSDLIEH